MTHKIHRECESAIACAAEINKRANASHAAYMAKSGAVLAFNLVLAFVCVVLVFHMAEKHVARMDLINQEMTYVKR